MIQMSSCIIIVSIINFKKVIGQLKEPKYSHNGEVNAIEDRFAIWSEALAIAGISGSSNVAHDSSIFDGFDDPTDTLDSAHQLAPDLAHRRLIVDDILGTVLDPLGGLVKSTLGPAIEECIGNIRSGA